MVQLIDGKFCIDYNDFMYLLDSSDWALSKGKYGWTSQRHIDSIKNLINTNANVQFEFIIDNNTLNQARIIDVFIISNRQDAANKHFQFVKT
ncbi:MAG: hypothetical protein J6X22_04280 [Muribaculaceae bacterium]|nr:hypothetical protein [Muribaculaceae bacterium]